MKKKIVLTITILVTMIVTMVSLGFNMFFLPLSPKPLVAFLMLASYL